MLQLLVAGDPWRSLPHVAGAELWQALERLMKGADNEARAVAEDVINTLGAQGFLEYRELLENRAGWDLPTLSPARITSHAEG